MKKYYIDGKIFESEEEAMQFALVENLSFAEIEEISVDSEEILGEKVIEEEPEENPDEDSAVTQREVDAMTALAHYNELDDQTKKEVLSVALGTSTGEAHDKVFPRKMTTSEVLNGGYLEDMLAKISDGQCPVSGCGLHWSQLSVDLSESAKEDLKEPLILCHIEKEHHEVYKLLKELIPIPEDPKDSKDNHCKKTELSLEELANAIKADPELRREFYPKAFKKLSERDQVTYR